MRHVASVLIGAIVLLGACAPGQEAAEGPEAKEIDYSTLKGKSMTYVYFTDGPDEAATRSLIDAFQKETGATVNLQLVPFDDLEKSLQARLAGDNAPDVARTNDIQPFRDDLLNLEGYFGEDLRKQFLDGPLRGATGRGGELLALPSDLTMNGPFVNTDQFKKAGEPLPTADKPWSWEEMIAAAERVQAANGTEFALAIDKSGHRVSTMLSQYGTTVIGEDGKAALDTKKAEDALGTFTDLVKSDKISRDFWLGSGTKYKGANDIFLAQAAPVYISGNWQVAQFEQNAQFGWAAVPNPCAERCGGFPGGKFMAAFKQSKEPELAAAFVEWMNRKENQSKFVTESLFLPTRKDLTDEGLAYPKRDKDMDVFLEEVRNTEEDTYATIASPAFTGTATEIVAQTANVIAGVADVPTAVAAIKQKTEQLVEETG